MAKLTKIERELFNDAMDFANDLDVTIISYRDEGITIAASYIRPLKNHYMLAITYCGPNDTFKRKLGVINVMEKLKNDNFIVMPAQYNDIKKDIYTFMENNFGYSSY